LRYRRGSYPNNNVVSGRGQATWHVTPLFDLTGGLRYTTEDKKGRVVQNDLANASPFSALPVFRAWDSGELKRTDESVASAGSAFGTQAITVDPEKANNIDLGVLTNVGDVTSKGFEFDIKARATSNLTLNFNGAYTLARFDSGTGPARFEAFDGVAYGRGSQSLKGNQVNGAPKWVFNVGAQYRHFLDSGIEQRVTTNYAWRDDSYGDIKTSSTRRSRPTACSTWAQVGASPRARSRVGMCRCG
jgi:iron complex outermembrane recepter protein